MDQNSQFLTTFITNYGRFKYLWGAPYGISSITEHCDCCTAETFAGLTGFHCIVDDIVMYDDDIVIYGDDIVI